ncbi:MULTISPECIES: hypothetical protein [Streptomyces]|uniref:Uncharacterized protein n=1 Tax=Streptomyces pseudovenezuelae TaxID=67350 RepID=A0ABZ1X0U3_9ACTN|nr:MULTISPECIES: hypothetical protein [Streptomyces]
MRSWAVAAKVVVDTGVAREGHGGWVRRSARVPGLPIRPAELMEPVVRATPTVPAAVPAVSVVPMVLAVLVVRR